jgi:hypothetical protein
VHCTGGFVIRNIDDIPARFGLVAIRRMRSYAAAISWTSRGRKHVKIDVWARGICTCNAGSRSPARSGELGERWLLGDRSEHRQPGFAGPTLPFRPVGHAVVHVIFEDREACAIEREAYAASC